MVLGMAPRLLHARRPQPLSQVLWPLNSSLLHPHFPSLWALLASPYHLPAGLSPAPEGPTCLMGAQLWEGRFPGSSGSFVGLGGI